LAERLPSSYKTFSELVKTIMKERRISQKNLVTNSGLSRTTISRICRNSNDKGSTYQAESLSVVMAICIGLDVYDAEEQKKLFYTAFPEFSAWEHITKEKMSIVKADGYLDAQGLPLLGAKKEEEE